MNDDDHIVSATMAALQAAKGPAPSPAPPATPSHSLTEITQMLHAALAPGEPPLALPQGTPPSLDQCKQIAKLGLQGELAGKRLAGWALNQAKAQVPHGQFLPWAQKELGLSRFSTADYMIVDRRWEEVMAAAGDEPPRSIRAFMEVLDRIDGKVAAPKTPPALPPQTGAGDVGHAQHLPEAPTATPQPASPPTPKRATAAPQPTPPSPAASPAVSTPPAEPVVEGELVEEEPPISPPAQQPATPKAPVTTAGATPLSNKQAARLDALAASLLDPALPQAIRERRMDAIYNRDAAPGSAHRDWFLSGMGFAHIYADYMCGTEPDGPTRMPLSPVSVDSGTA